MCMMTLMHMLVFHVPLKIVFSCLLSPSSSPRSMLNSVEEFASFCVEAEVGNSR